MQRTCSMICQAHSHRKILFKNCSPERFWKGPYHGGDRRARAARAGANPEPRRPGRRLAGNCGRAAVARVDIGEVKPRHLGGKKADMRYGEISNW